MNTKLLIDKVKEVRGLNMLDMEAFHVLVDMRIEFLRYQCTKFPAGLNGFAQTFSHIPVKLKGKSSDGGTLFVATHPLPRVYMDRTKYLILSVRLNGNGKDASYISPNLLNTAGRVGINRDTLYFTLIDSYLYIKFPKAVQHLTAAAYVSAEVVLENPDDYELTVHNFKGEPFVREDFSFRKSDFPVPTEFISFISNNGKGVTTASTSSRGEEQPTD